MYDKTDKANVDRLLAHFFFDHNIAFNVIQSQLFFRFCQALSDFGASYKVPSYSNKLVDTSKNEVDHYVSQMKELWPQSGSGCTLMLDGWIDLKGYWSMPLIMRALVKCLWKYILTSIKSSATHGVQLLLKDIDKDIAWIRDTLEEAKDIVNVITKSPTMKALLRKMIDNQELKKIL